MMSLKQFCAGLRVAAAFLFVCFAASSITAQQLDEASVIHGIDAAVKTRFENIAKYTVTEHYAVYRNNDETHPVAEMTVQTVYQKETGKSYTILSQSGSTIIQSMVLKPILDNEKRINQPGNREASWFTSANYEMKLKPGGTQRLDGRDCFVVAVTPRQKAPDLIVGTIWVDAKDYSTVQIQGTASKSLSLLTGLTEVMRQYAPVSGFAQATHATAVSNSFLFGQTVVKIDYQDYQVQLLPSR